MKAITSFIKEHSLALLLVMGYLVLLAPYALNYVFYMPDERHYVDAAIHMLKHGDYLSPINPDGGYRFLKPIFTYWVVLASYAIFGISEFSSRFPFLLTAGMVLWLTYRTTLLAFKKKEIAFLALIIAGASPLLQRSTPLTLTDLLLLVLLQVIIWGIIALLVCAEKKRKHWWAIYLGAGMAVMTKGLPAIAFLLVALFFLLVNPWKRFKLKEALHLPALFTGMVLGGFWYVAIYLQHGSEAIASFYEDQVGMRVAEKIGLIAMNFIWSVLVIVFIMFPFMLPGWRSLFYQNQEIKEHRNIKAIIGFATLWVLAMIGMSTLVSKFYYRYLIPVIPVMAMIMAFSIWSQQDKKAVQRLLKTIRIFAFILFITVNIAGIAAITLFFGPRWYFLVLAANILTSAYFFFKTKQAEVIKQSILTYLLMAGILWSLFFVIQPISSPGEGQQLLNKLHEMNIKSSDHIQFYGKTRIASRLRVETKGDYFLKAWTPSESPILPETDFLLIEDRYLDSLNLENFDISIASTVWKDIRLDEIAAVKTKEELNALKEKRAETYYLGIKRK